MSLAPIAFHPVRKGASKPKTRTTHARSTRGRFKVAIDFSSSDDDDPLPTVTVKVESPLPEPDLESVSSSTADVADFSQKEEVNWGTTKTRGSGRLVHKRGKARRISAGSRPTNCKSSQSENSQSDVSSEPAEKVPSSALNIGQNGNEDGYAKKVGPAPPVPQDAQENVPTISSPNPQNTSGTTPKKRSVKRKVVRRGRRPCRGRGRMVYSDSDVNDHDKKSNSGDSEDSGDLIRHPKDPPIPLPPPAGSHHIVHLQSSSPALHRNFNPRAESKRNFTKSPTPLKIPILDLENGLLKSYTIVKDKTKQYRLMEGEKPIFFVQQAGKVWHIGTDIPVEEGKPGYFGFVKQHQIGKRFTVCSNEYKENDDRDPQVAGLAICKKNSLRMAIPIPIPTYPISKARDLSRLAQVGVVNPVFEAAAKNKQKADHVKNDQLKGSRNSPNSENYENEENRENSADANRCVLFFETGVAPDDGWMPSTDPSLGEEFRGVFALPSPKNHIFKDQSGNFIFMLWKTSNVGYNIRAREPLTPLMACGLALACVL